MIKANGSTVSKMDDASSLLNLFVFNACAGFITIVKVGHSENYCKTKKYMCGYVEAQTLKRIYSTCN